MAEVGSDEWIAALAARASEAAGSPTGRLVIQQELADTGRRWHVVVADGRVEVGAGPHPEPDVIFSQDLATAAAIAAGALSAQQAFAEGRLRVRGAVGRLVESVDAFAALGR
jgi:putative sterol carrier protein